MTIEYITLDNGMRVVCHHSPSIVSYAGFAVNVGSRDDDPSSPGIAHFVEHLLFKGTARHSPHYIINRMEQVGADLNAYTTKEETVIYSSFLNNHLGRAIDLMTDIVLHSSFAPAEVDRERSVILDETHSYLDDPSDQIFDNFEAQLFGNGAVGHPILGSIESVEAITAADCYAFHRRHYRPDRMVFFYEGSLSSSEVRRRLERALSSTEPCEAPTPHARTSPEATSPQQMVEEIDSHQVHTIIGAPSYGMSDTRLRAHVLLNNYIGGPCMNSLLNVALRERRGLCYTVESTIATYTDAGYYAIYFGTDPRNLDRCLSLVYKTLRGICEKSLPERTIASIKRQFIGQMTIAMEQREHLALSIAKSVLHKGYFMPLDESLARIEAVTAQQLLEVANEVYGAEGLSRLTFR